MQSLSAGSSNQLGHFFIKLHPVPFYSPVPLVILQCRSPILNRIPKNRQQSSRIFRDMFFFSCSSAVSVQFQGSFSSVSVQSDLHCFKGEIRTDASRIPKNPQESPRISKNLGVHGTQCCCSGIPVAFQWHSCGLICPV